MHRFSSAAVLTLAAVVALVGCGGGKSDDSGDPKKAADEAVYAHLAASADPDDLQGVKVSVLASEGHRICSMLGSGQSVADVVAYEELARSSREADVLISAAPALCPEQQGAIDSGLIRAG